MKTERLDSVGREITRPQEFEIWVTCDFEGDVEMWKHQPKKKECQEGIYFQGKCQEVGTEIMDNLLKRSFIKGEMCRAKIRIEYLETILPE